MPPSLDKWLPPSEDFLPQWMAFSLNNQCPPLMPDIPSMNDLWAWQNVSFLDECCLLPWWTVSSIDELPPPVCFTGRLIQWAPPSFDDWSLGLPLPGWMVSLPPTLTNGLILPSANNLLSQWTTPLLTWRCCLRFMIRRWELRLQVVNLSYIYGS